LRIPVWNCIPLLNDLLSGDKWNHHWRFPLIPQSCFKSICVYSFITQNYQNLGSQIPNFFILQYAHKMKKLIWLYRIKAFLYIMNKLDIWFPTFLATPSANSFISQDPITHPQQYVWHINWDHASSNRWNWYTQEWEESSHSHPFIM
jgi:hypothetical protein